MRISSQAAAAVSGAVVVVAVLWTANTAESFSRGAPTLYYSTTRAGATVQPCSIPSSIRERSASQQRGRRRRRRQHQQQLDHHHARTGWKPVTTTTTTTALLASTLDKASVEEKKTNTKGNNEVGGRRGKRSNGSARSDRGGGTAAGGSSSSSSMADRIANSGMASAAAVATAAVNAAVSMRTLEAPDVDKSYISLDRTDTTGITITDANGLPLRYDKDLIEAYWTRERGALNDRWRYFVGKAVPFLTKLTTLFIRDGTIDEREVPALSRRARIDLQDLGPTFIKAGQMMSVRPDVLPEATLRELSKLQDSVVPFDTATAVRQIEEELGGPLGQFFTSISDEPVAAASLAQVYLATLNDGADTRVAVKVQRPAVLSQVSKDLYVLRRAAEVFQGLVERFAPAQRTNYVALLNEWAVGFYTELDFANEAANQRRLKQLLADKNITGVTVPAVYDDLCTRRILVSEWMDGVKLSEATPEQIAAVTPAAQEAFLTQLFEVGFFHADPHPGNLLLLNEPTDSGATLALIDCGLMASIEARDRDHMISAVVHLANKNYAALVDDFINLNILPADTNRPVVVPLMDKALSPYVMGGGAKTYEREVRKMYGMEAGSAVRQQAGGFQAMTADALTVLNDVPFSIPPYFAILGRAIITLEGVALTGNPDYGLIMESYPFIARKLLSDRGRPEIQKALQEVLYSAASSNDPSSSSSGRLKWTRLLTLLNNAAGAVATQDGAAFVDLDTVPENGIGLLDGVKFLLSDAADSLRAMLEPEVDTAVDVLTRQVLRRALQQAVQVLLQPPRPPSLPLIGNVFPTPPALDNVPLPILLPGKVNEQQQQEEGSDFVIGNPSLTLVTVQELIDTVAPKLNQDEEIYAIGLADGAREFLGPDIADLLTGERVVSAEFAQLALRAVRSGLFGRNDLLSNTAVTNVLTFVDGAIRSVRRSGNGGGSSRSSGGASDSNRSGSSYQEEFTTALDSLSETEREQLQQITTELVRRSVRRTLQRLSKLKQEGS